MKHNFMAIVSKINDFIRLYKLIFIATKEESNSVYHRHIYFLGTTGFKKIYAYNFRCIGLFCCERFEETPNEKVRFS